MFFNTFSIKHIKTQCFHDFSSNPNLLKIGFQKKTSFRLDETLLFLDGWSSKVHRLVTSSQTMRSRLKTRFRQDFKRNDFDFETDRFQSKTVQTWSEAGWLGDQLRRQSSLKGAAHAAQPTTIVQMVFEMGWIRHNLTNFTDVTHEFYPPYGNSK